MEVADGYIVSLYWTKNTLPPRTHLSRRCWANAFLANHAAGRGTSVTEVPLI